MYFKLLLFKIHLKTKSRLVVLVCRAAQFGQNCVILYIKKIINNQEIMIVNVIITTK